MQSFVTKLCRETIMAFPRKKGYAFVLITRIILPRTNRAISDGNNASIVTSKYFVIIFAHRNTRWLQLETYNVSNASITSQDSGQ